MTNSFNWIQDAAEPGLAVSAFGLMIWVYLSLTEWSGQSCSLTNPIPSFWVIWDYNREIMIEVSVCIWVPRVPAFCVWPCASRTCLTQIYLSTTPHSSLLSLYITHSYSYLSLKSIQVKSVQQLPIAYCFTVIEPSLIRGPPWHQGVVRQLTQSHAPPASACNSAHHDWQTQEIQ